MPSNFASLCYRKLVKNLWMGYFHASDQKKSEVVQLMGKILGFSQEELDQVCCELPLSPHTLWSYYIGSHVLKASTVRN